MIKINNCGLFRKSGEQHLKLFTAFSFEEKPYTDENDLIRRHYDHSRQGLVKGINFLNSLHQTDDIVSPIGFDLVEKNEQYLDPKDAKEKHRSLISKNELARD